jgi:hypothetical protein
MSEDGFVAGVIHPSPDGGAPLFKVVHRNETWNLGENVRPCDHGNFVLDARWATVTCGECKTQVDPFSALMSFADWWGELTHRQSMAEEAERRMLRQSLRGLAAKVDAKPDEAEIRALADRSWGMPIHELRAEHRRLDRAASERRRARRSARPVRRRLHG